MWSLYYIITEKCSMDVGLVLEFISAYAIAARDRPSAPVPIKVLITSLCFR